MVDMIDETSLYIWRAIGILFSFAIIFFIFEVQKKKINRLNTSNQHSSIVLLYKRHAGNVDYAGINEITRIDGLKAETFLYCVGVPAVYLSPGEHVIEVKAYWSRHIRGQRFKEHRVGPRNIRVEVGHGEIWSLEYQIKEDKFTFTKCNTKKMFKRA